MNADAPKPLTGDASETAPDPLPFPARRAQPAPRAPRPRPAPSHGGTLVIVGITFGLLLASVTLLLVELGAQASLLRLAGVKGKYETEAAEQLAAAQAERESKERDAAHLTKKLAESERVAADRLSAERTEFEERLKRERASAALDAVEKYKGSRPPPPPPAKAAPPSESADVYKDKVRVLELDNRKLRLELAAKAAPPAPVPQGYSGPPVVVGLTAPLADDARHTLVELPPGKYTLDVFGLDPRWVGRDTGSKQAVTIREPGRDWSAEVAIDDRGALTVRGKNVARHPHLALAAVRVQPERGVPLHYYIVGPQAPFRRRMETTDGRAFGQLAELYEAIRDEGARLDVRGLAKELDWGGPASVKVGERWYTLTPVAKPEAGKRELAFEQRPEPDEPSRVRLTYLPQRNEVLLAAEFSALQEKRPIACEVVADLVREVAGPDGRPIRQTVVRIR